MDKAAVLDASALMALIRGEEGADAVFAAMPRAVISTVNQAEVQTKLVSAGLDELLAWWHIAEAQCPSVPFDEEQARVAGGLVKVTRPYGLSLGDRACLALAIEHKATVYTTDAAWKNLGLEIEIEVIR
ncbi:MAG: type II toxin-antitoxin system VapC family toxin [Terracidiphilus sp.]